jgi:regulator of sigma E protease
LDLTGLIPFAGNTLWTVVFFILALSVIVTVHELGHYLVGRWSGIAAEVFSVGIGPVLVSRTDRHGTRWQIAAFPIGGFVKFLGDSGATSGRDENVLAVMDDETRRRTVHGAPLWARAATVAAGPVFNFILSIIVFAGVLYVEGVAREPMAVAQIQPMPGEDGVSQGLRPGDVLVTVEGATVPTDSTDWSAFYDSLPDKAVLRYGVLRDGQPAEVDAPHLFPPLVGGVAPDSAAGDVGLQRGDVIQAIDGAPIATFADLRARAGASDGKPMVLSVWRDGTTTDFTLVPRRVDLPLDGGAFETRWLIGITGGLLFEPETRYPGPWEAVTYGADQTWRIVVSSVSGLYHMAVGAISSCNLRGPLGIAQTSGEAASQGITAFIWFIAVLSTAVGLLNLFPVPVLDGGHLVFHAWEAVTGRAPSDRALKALMSVGLVLLLALMAFALTNDLRC